jgi:hypothetical protein
VRPAGTGREWRKARRRSWITQARKSRRPEVQRFGLPAGPPVTEDETYAALVSWGGLVVAAENGVVTEITRPDGRVAARIMPA